MYWMVIDYALMEWMTAVTKEMRGKNLKYSVRIYSQHMKWYAIYEYGQKLILYTWYISEGVQWFCIKKKCNL